MWLWLVGGIAALIVLAKRTISGNAPEPPGHAIPPWGGNQPPRAAKDPAERPAALPELEQVLATVTPTATVPAQTRATPVAPPAAVQDLASKLVTHLFAASTWTLRGWASQTFDDAALGWPASGESAAAARVPGYALTFAGDGGKVAKVRVDAKGEHARTLVDDRGVGITYASAWEAPTKKGAVSLTSVVQVRPRQTQPMTMAPPSIFSFATRMSQNQIWTPEYGISTKEVVVGMHPDGDLRDVLEHFPSLHLRQEMTPEGPFLVAFTGDEADFVSTIDAVGRHPHVRYAEPNRVARF